jgi:hypothetical protein
VIKVTANNQHPSGSGKERPHPQHAKIIPSFHAILSLLQMMLGDADPHGHFNRAWQKRIRKCTVACKTFLLIGFSSSSPVEHFHVQCPTLGNVLNFAYNHCAANSLQALLICQPPQPGRSNVYITHCSALPQPSFSLFKAEALRVHNCKLEAVKHFLAGSILRKQQCIKACVAGRQLVRV